MAAFLIMYGSIKAKSIMQAGSGFGFNKSRIENGFGIMVLENYGAALLVLYLATGITSSTTLQDFRLRLLLPPRQSDLFIVL